MASALTGSPKCRHPKPLDTVDMRQACLPNSHASYMATEYVTGLQVLAVLEPGMADTFTNHLNVPHAVWAFEGSRRARTVCGVKVNEVRAEVPFPPMQSLALPRQPCSECLAFVAQRS